MAKLLIVGCGYVGNELAVQLDRAGHEVFALRRRPQADGTTNIRWIQGDVCAPGGLDALPEAFDCVYYLVSADGHTPEAYRKAYVDGLRHVLARVSEQGAAPKRFVFVSSTGVYGQDDGTWIDETSATEPRGFSGAVLLEGEALLGQFDIPYTIVRFSGIYGPGREQMINTVRQGTAIIEEADHRVSNHIHRDDCAGFLAHLLTLDRPATLYLGTDSAPTPRTELIHWIARTLQVPAPQPVPAEAPGVERRPRGGNRYYSNARMRATGYALQFPGYREGYGALIDDNTKKVGL